MRSYMTIKVATSALLSVAAFMSMPPYRFWAVGSILMLAAAFLALSKRPNRWLLVAAFAGAGLYGFIIGQLFWDGSQLTDDGLLTMLPLVPVLAVVVLRIFMVERDAA